MAGELRKLYQTEDYWAVWLGLGIVLVALVTYWAGGTIGTWAVTPGSWSNLDGLAADLSRHGPGYVVMLLAFGVVFSASMKIMGHNLRHFVAGFLILFFASTIVFYLAEHSVLRALDVGAPLLALIVGLVVGNLVKLPSWFDTSLRTEYYIKTGIVLLGATLPLTLVFSAGPIAFLQATLVSVGTWFTIYLVGTRLFKLEPPFAAVLGAGGAVCGVSASIAVGGAVKAKKDHIAISIAIVSVWALVMILALSVALKFLVPTPLSPGEAGAWVGNSEFADAAGFAVVAELSDVIEKGGILAHDGSLLNPDDPIHAFTLMKVIGRDIWIGIWALVLAVVSVVYWEKGQTSQRTVGAGVVWERFPKFVFGFFAASLIMTVVTANPPADHVGKARLVDTYNSKTEKIAYQADFTDYEVPSALAGRFTVAADAITFKGKMTVKEFELLKAGLRPDDPNRRDKIGALKQLRYKSDWYGSEVVSKVISPVKALRSWAFVLCFLCIGLSTRFRDLLTFGLKPFWAFSCGVLVNVPLGYVLSTVVFSRFWSGISALI